MSPSSLECAAATSRPDSETESKPDIPVEPPVEGAVQPPPSPGNASASEWRQPAKTARILEENDAAFGLEYDNNRGTKNTMRLDALTYEDAIREARSFLGIQEGDRDEDGVRWEVE